MSVFKTYKFQTMRQLEQHLNGAMRGGRYLKNGYPGLKGLTLIFSKPSVTTVTFTASTVNPNVPDLLQFTDVKSQIETAMAGAGLKVYAEDDVLIFQESTPSQGVAFSGGTGLATLGLTVNDIGRVYSYPDGSTAAVAPHFVSLIPWNGMYGLLVKE